MAVEVGQVLDGKYRILRLIGKGGMGAVYEAEHLLIDRRVAVKELHAEAAAAAHAVTRFEREARAAGRIGSDHILQIFDVGSLPDGCRYMVSELLHGETLATRVKRLGHLTPQQLFPIARQLLVGLAAAHSAGVLHRDLKPDNIFVEGNKGGITDFVKIIDFGIAKFQQISTDDALKMTKTGMVVGTPYYLSPEQARGTANADARSDLYAVGVILYECVTGQVPFNALNFNDLIFKIVLESPLAPADHAISVERRFSDLILKAMAREPDARFQTAAEFLSALDEWAATSAGRTWAPGSRSGGVSRPALSRNTPIEDFRSPGDGGFNTVAAPTPSTFGKTRDPQFWADAEPRRSFVKPLLIGGSALLLIGGGLFVASRYQNDSPAAAASITPAPLGSARAPTSAGPAQVTALPTSRVAPVDEPLPNPSLGNDNPLLPRDDAPRVDSKPIRPARTRTPTRVTQPHGSPAASVPAPANAATTATTPTPAPPPAKRADPWGY